MFTGLVEGRGTVLALQPERAAIRLSIQTPHELWAERADGGEIGDSIAINGCCLTVVERDDTAVSFQAGEETLSKTNLGDLTPGAPVNLERALPATGRMGGHFVQGHVDGAGTVEAIERSEEWVDMTFRVPPALAAQMVPKGSITIDGVSLTLVNVGPETMSVALIPHTLEVTTLGVRRPGDRVNIETDIIGKYVQKYLVAHGQS